MSVPGRIRYPHLVDPGHWEWDWLAGCFGDGLISPTDVDGMVERRGHFLFIETKMPGAELPEGQRAALERLVSKLGPWARLMVLYGEKDQPTAAQIFRRGKWSEKHAADIFRVREFARRWYEMADRGDAR